MQSLRSRFWLRPLLTSTLLEFLYRAGHAVQTQLTHSQAAREPSRYHREPSHHLWAGYCLDKSHWFRWSLAAEKADCCTVYLLHHHRQPRQQHSAKKHQCEAGTNWKSQWKRWIYIHRRFTSLPMSASGRFKTLWHRHTSWSLRGSLAKRGVRPNPPNPPWLHPCDPIKKP